MEELLQRILAEIQGIKQDIEVLTNRIDLVATMTAKRFNELEARMDRFEADTNERFNRLEARMDQLDKKFDHHAAEFHQFRRENERAHGIIEGKLDKLNGRIFELEGVVAQNVTEINALQDAVFE
ncbi:MAG TPA: hypothetical protein GXX34_06215 [Clostridia bacterium]|nr:hypothetical protein [Clostridia bacterium]